MRLEPPTVLQAVQLPAGIANLTAGLADVDRNTLSLKVLRVIIRIICATPKNKISKKIHFKTGQAFDYYELRTVLIDI